MGGYRCGELVQLLSQEARHDVEVRHELTT
jgi:hypothetical protein